VHALNCVFADINFKYTYLAIAREIIYLCYKL